MATSDRLKTPWRDGNAKIIRQNTIGLALPTMNLSQESGENLDKIPELVVFVGVVEHMRADLRSRRESPVVILSRAIEETVVGSLLLLILSSWPSPAIGQTLDPQIKSRVTTSGILRDKTLVQGDRSLRSHALGESRTTEPPRQKRLRPDRQALELRDRPVTSAAVTSPAVASGAVTSPAVTSQNRDRHYTVSHDRQNREDRPDNTDLSTDPSKEANSDVPPIAPDVQLFAQLIETGMESDRWELHLEPNPDPLAQITSVSQLSDVKPTDWAFQALQSLVERYGCLSGYPDLTYRGNRALTRYEFAAALNTCWDRIDELIQANRSSGISPEDLKKLEQLYRDFAQEVAIVNDLIQALETQTSQLQGQQFSTTSKLFGQAIFGVQGRFANEADFFPVDDEKETKDPGTELNFINNVQLTLLTQLNSRSLILAGMQMGNGSTGPRLSNDTRLGYEGNTEGQMVLSDLNYRQLISNRLAVIIGPAGVNMANVFRGVNEVESAGRGPISALAQRNPIVNIGNGRGGVGFDWQVTSRMSVQGVYSASTPGDVSNGGLFGGDDGQTTLGMQLTFTPMNNLDLAINYVNTYSPFGVLGTGSGDDQLTVDSPIETNGFGASVSWNVTPSVTFGSWAGYTNSGIPGRGGNVETTNWMVFLNWDNLFARGNLGGIYIGQPPKIVNSKLPVGKNIPDLLAGGEGEAGGQPGTTTHVELFYRWQVSDRLSFTPGLLAIFEPGHTPASDPITVGVLRTTFTF